MSRAPAYIYPHGLHALPRPRPCLTPLPKDSLMLEFLLHCTLRGTQFTSFNSVI